MSVEKIHTAHERSQTGRPFNVPGSREPAVALFPKPFQILLQMLEEGPQRFETALRWHNRPREGMSLQKLLRLN